MDGEQGQRTEPNCNRQYLLYAWLMEPAGTEHLGGCVFGWSENTPFRSSGEARIPWGLLFHTSL